MYLVKNGMYFVATSRWNVSPTQVLAILSRLVSTIRDFSGTLTEEAVRRNFTLVYELLDEMVDFGYPQQMATESLRSFVFNAPIEDPSAAQGHSSTSAAISNALEKMKLHEKKTVSSTAAQRSVISSPDQKDRRSGQTSNEIFVDITERITATFTNTGTLQYCLLFGAITMRSFLMGSPEIRMGLNPDLNIGKKDGKSTQLQTNIGTVTVDDMCFHECVRLSAFEVDRTLSLLPPDGEFTVLSYRAQGEYAVPFRVYPFFEENSNFRMDLVIKIRSEFPAQCSANNVVVQFRVPQTATSVGFDLAVPTVPQETEFKQSDKTVCWKIRKFPGGTEIALRAKIALPVTATKVHKRQTGPIALTFEIPMFNVSGLNLKFLHISERDQSYNPTRWIRYITQSESYVVRL